MFSKSRNNKRKIKNSRFRRFQKTQNRNSIQLKNIMNTIVPDKVRVKLMVTAFQSIPFSTIDAAATYSGNGLANPFLGNSPDQCPGYLQWMTFYEKYRVIKSFIRIQAINDGVSALNRAIWLSIYPSRNTVTPLPDGYISASAQPYVRSKFLGAVTAIDKATVTNNISTSKIIGMNIMYEDDFVGVVDANPTNQFYWQVGLTGLPDGTDFPVISYMVTISYIVDLFNRKPLATSDFIPP